MQHPEYRARIHPALTSFADECYATLARLIAYVGALALLGIGALQSWQALLTEADFEPAARHLRLAIILPDKVDNSNTYLKGWGTEGSRKVARPAGGRAGQERGSASNASVSPDWLMAVENPRLRGSL